MSTSTIFKFPRVIRQQHEGPLGFHIDAYEALLREHGYSRASTYVHLHIVADLSRWLKRRKLDVDDVDERMMGHYLQSRRHFVDGYRGASSVLSAIIIYNQTPGRDLMRHVHSCGGPRS
jgi:hypothetical protein